MIPGSRIRETVLYYSPEKKAYEMKLKGLLVRMGIRIRVVSPEQTGALVGDLLSGSQEAAGSALSPVIPEEMLVMLNFSGRRMDEFFAAMRKAGIPRISLKAVVTDTNRTWTFAKLYEEISEEHRLMTGGTSEAEKQGGEEHV
jgi:hypothetical protein